MLRLQKFISDSGLTSRRKAEELITSGRVRVNGLVAELGCKVDEQNDVVEVDGKRITLGEKHIYIMLNKPEGYLSSVTDDRGRKTVVELIGLKERIFPVGRLDYDTEGLLLLTNDGEFTYRVTHPKFEITKTYIATLDKRIMWDRIKVLLDGVEIEDYVGTANALHIINENKNQVMITISQGKNRQVRKMFEKTGYTVKKLQRISIGALRLANLKKGEWRELSKKEAEKIFEKNSI